MTQFSPFAGSFMMMNMNGHQATMSMSMTAANMMDDMSEPSSPDSSSATPFEEADLLQTAINDDVSAQLAAAGRRSNSDDVNECQ